MNNLLNEEEFLPKEYNPNKWLTGFYIGAFIFAIVMLIAFRFIRIENVVLRFLLQITTGIIIPIGLSMFIILGKREILLDAKKSDIVKGIFVLQVCFFVPGILLNAYEYYSAYLYRKTLPELLSFSIIYIPLGLSLIFYLITLAIVIPLVNRARKIKDRILP